MRTRGLLLLFAAYFVSTAGFAQELAIPELTSPVQDQAGLLTTRKAQQLDRTLRTLYSQTKTQLAILIVPTLNGESIEQASIKVAEKWKLGTAKEDRGVLLMMAIKERRMRIEVGQGLEGDLPDAYAKRIIDEVIAPLMRERAFDDAVTLGVAAIVQRTDPEFPIANVLGVRASDAVRGGPARTLSLTEKIFFFAVLFLLFLLFVRYPSLFFLLLLSSSRRGSGGYGGYYGGRGSGGGGWSGGGGGFSGGGASGGW